MTEYFRIEGKNLIDFDRQMVTGTAPIHCLSQGRPPTDLGKPLTRGEIVAQLSRVPLGIRGHALNRGMSMVTFPFDIQADTDPEMELALHNLKRMLNEGQLYIESESARGTRAVLHYKSDNAAQHSYKTIYYGYLAEAGARDVLGPRAKESYLANAQLTLYMEPKWRPASAITLGPNEIYCPGLEEDGNADGLADNWVLLNAPAPTMERTIVLQGFYSQKLVTGAFVGRGIQSATFVAPAGTTAAVCYAWLCRPAAGSDIIVELYDVTTPAVVASALYNTAGWETETAKDGTSVFKRVVVSSAAGIVAGRTYRMRIYNTVDTGATYYVDKGYWKWGTATAPDEWCDHWLVYNHYDTTEGAAHVGHQNYFDVADLKGTDDARLLLKIVRNTTADLSNWKEMLVGRRSSFCTARAIPVTEVHWLEAENATVQWQWADSGALARCSAGECVEDDNVDAHTTGYVRWQGWPFGFAGTPDADMISLDWDVFGVVYTNDAENTQYRLSYTIMDYPTNYNHWVKQGDSAYWQMIYLGGLHLSRFMPLAHRSWTIYIDVEYGKHAADTVRLDCIWLIPRAECQAKYRLKNYIGMHYLHADRIEDFDCDAITQVNVGTWHRIEDVFLQGDVMTLTPGLVVGQRLYFSASSIDIGPDPDVLSWEAHGAAHDLNWIMEAHYLPQYQTPLD